MPRVLIVPAAGAGTRLQSPGPKLLHPVAGRPMIDHVLDLYEGVVDRAMLVLHPSAVDAVRRHCAAPAIPIEYHVQEHPTGMLDAILVPHRDVRAVSPDWVFVTWCDQVAVLPTTVAALAARCVRGSPSALIFPTSVHREPYIHLVRNAGGRITAISHRREGDAMPEVGESDIGLFALSAQAYGDRLPRYANEVERGSHTGERNFLPFIVWLGARAPDAVETFPCHEAVESVGINTIEDLRRVEEHLRTRGTVRPA